MTLLKLCADLAAAANNSDSLEFDRLCAQAEGLMLDDDEVTLMQAFCENMSEVFDRAN